MNIWVKSRLGEGLAGPVEATIKKRLAKTKGAISDIKAMFEDLRM